MNKLYYVCGMSPPDEKGYSVYEAHLGLFKSYDEAKKKIEDKDNARLIWHILETIEVDYSKMACKYPKEIYHTKHGIGIK